MGQALKLEPDALKAEDAHEIKELKLARMALVKDRIRLLSRIKTQKLTITKRQSRAQLRQIEHQIKTIEAEIAKRLRANPERSRALDILAFIPGVGEVSAAAIMIECPEIGRLGQRQITSLAGLAPMARQPGQWKGHAFIQGGRKHLRDALYRPALVATRFNPDPKAKYTRLRARRKPEKRTHSHHTKAHHTRKYVHKRR